MYLLHLNWTQWIKIGSKNNCAWWNCWCGQNGCCSFIRKYCSM
jgi:hypothetical protein